MNNKFYIVLIGLIIIVAAVGGYFALQTNVVPENRSAVMDKYVLDGNHFDEIVSAKRNQTNELAQTGQYQEMPAVIDEQIDAQKKKVDADQKALEYADGDFKTFISMRLEYDQLWLRYMEDYKENVECRLNGDISKSFDAYKRQQGIYSEIMDDSGDITDFINSHGDVANHISSYWNAKPI